MYLFITAQRMYSIYIPLPPHLQPLQFVFNKCDYAFLRFLLLFRGINCLIAYKKRI